MITLEVEDYCHDCPRFNPEVTRLFSDNNCVITEVRCENAARCARLKRYLESKISENDKND